MGKVKFQFTNFKQAAAYSKWFVSQTFSFIACTTNWFGQISHLQSKLVLLCYYYHAQFNSIAIHDCSEEVILTLPTKQNRKWQRSRRLPPRHPSKAMDEDRGHRLDDRRGRRLGWGLGRGGGGGRGERRNGRSVVAPAAGEGPPRQTRPAPIVGKWVEIGLRSRPERRRFGADRTDRGGARRIQTGVPAFGRAEGGAARASEKRGRREELRLAVRASGARGLTLGA